MKHGKRKIMLALVLILSFQGRTQDIHFSSTGFNPMFFNPAMTAFMNNTFRVSTIYRNQWQTISEGYNTFFAAFELQPWSNVDASRAVGLGLCFTSDVAGSLSFGERDIAIAGSYFFSLDRNNKTYISVGGEAMRKNWSMNLLNAEFNPEGIYNDEIKYENLNTYDLSLGVSFQHVADDEHLLYAGVSCFHINQPSLSYFDNDDIYLHRRLFANLSYMFPFKNSETISLNPQVFYQHQHKFNEILIGGEFLLKINDMIFTREIFSLGLYLRNADALVVSPKFRYNNFIAGMSYDVNISKLNKVSATYGAFEIWLSYAFDPYYQRQKTTKIPCPIF